MISEYVKDGDAIYRASFALIRAEAHLAGLSPTLERVVVRMIHACGMTDLPKDVDASPEAAEIGRDALAAGAPIFCDAMMVAEGVTRKRLPRANDVICTLRDPRVAALAADLGTTRSAAALELWRDRLGGAVVAIGNAPTALFRLLEMLAAGAPRPALILGMPVGFIGAAESKEALARSGLAVPFITLHGRRGGSAIVSAAVNALASDRRRSGLAGGSSEVIGRAVTQRRGRRSTFGDPRRMRKISFIEAAVKGYARQYDRRAERGDRRPFVGTARHFATRFLDAVVGPERVDALRTAVRSAAADPEVPLSRIFDPNVKTLEELRRTVNEASRTIAWSKRTSSWAERTHLGVDAENFPADQTFKAFLAHAGGEPTRGELTVCFPGHVTPENAAAVAREKVDARLCGQSRSGYPEVRFFRAGTASIEFRPVAGTLPPSAKRYLTEMLPGLGATAVVTYPRQEALADEPFADQRISTMLKKLDDKVGPIALYGPPGQSNKATLVFQRDGVSTGASASARALAD